MRAVSKKNTNRLKLFHRWLYLPARDKVLRENGDESESLDEGNLLLIYIFKYVFEPAIILFQDCILGAHVKRHFFVKGHFETSMCEVNDGLQYMYKIHSNYSQVIGSQSRFSEALITGSNKILAHIFVKKIVTIEMFCDIRCLSLIH